MLPLKGIRIVELTTAWAGPMAGRVLAHFGAESIHVESPTRTNTWRVNRDAPNPLSYPDMEPGERPFDRAFLFNSQNVNKRSLAIDLKKPEGLDILRRLLNVSDVLICNFRPGMLSRLGLDHATLSESNPGIVVAEMPAFGLHGPHARFAALGPTMEMAAGMSAMIAYPCGKPSVTGPSYLDPIGGFNAAAAIMTALFERHRTGKGMHLEVPQVESAMQFIGPELMAGSDRVPDGNHVAHMAPHNAYRARGKDEWVVVAVADDSQWRALSELIGDAAEDGRFATLAGRLAHQTELDALVAAWLAHQDKHEAAERLQSAGIAAAAVNSPRDLAESAYLRHRGFFTELDHPQAGRHLHPGLPFHAEVAAGAARSAAPCFGADNLYVLRDLLGMDDDQVATVIRSGAIANTPNPGA